MGRVLGPLFAVALATAGGGCGTLASAVWLSPSEGGQRVYGGVQADLAIAQADAKEKETAAPVETKNRVLAAVDLPFSLVGDTLALPFTVPCQLWRASNPDPYGFLPNSLMADGGGGVRSAPAGPPTDGRGGAEPRPRPGLSGNPPAAGPVP